MPDRAEIEPGVQTYVRHLGSHDVEKLVALYADNAVHHEPLVVKNYRRVDKIRTTAGLIAGVRTGRTEACLVPSGDLVGVVKQMDMLGIDLEGASCRN
ncbi:nuclear transport factor 2 family protein [Rhodococcus globerulus]|uniref:nuclear transport factor 2 family protein n=1 Tax=Rhodococcus globerulus TaxID=33008 RepID=UPI003019FA8E